MTLKTDILTDRDVFFNTNEFADTAIYTPPGGSAEPITIVKEDQDPGIMPDIPPGDEMIISVSALDNPLQGGVVEIDSVTWYLLGILGTDRGVMRLQLTRSERRQI